MVGKKRFARMYIATVRNSAYKLSINNRGSSAFRLIPIVLRGAIKLFSCSAVSTELERVWLIRKSRGEFCFGAER